MPSDSDSDYYGAGSANGDATTATPEDNQPQAGDQEDADTGETTLIPKSVFGNNVPAVGDDLVVKVEHIWEDEVEVSYVKPEESPEGSMPGKKKSTMDDAMSAMDQMNQPADEE